MTSKDAMALLQQQVAHWYVMNFCLFIVYTILIASTIINIIK